MIKIASRNKKNLTMKRYIYISLNSFTTGRVGFDVNFLIGAKLVLNVGKVKHTQLSKKAKTNALSVGKWSGRPEFNPNSSHTKD